jgi:hypothetical protein
MREWIAGTHTSSGTMRHSTCGETSTSRWRRVILGHRSPSMTELYGEFDHRKALAIMERVG